MSKSLTRVISVFLLAAILLSAFATVAFADGNFTVSDEKGEISESQSKQEKDVQTIKEHAMKKFVWLYYLIAFLSVALVITGAIVITKKLK